MSLSTDRTAEVHAYKNARALRDVFADLGAEARYNSRSGACEIRIPPPLGSDSWQPLHDRRTAWLRDHIAETCRYKLANGGEARLAFGADAFADALNVITATAEVDPFQVWLEDLPPWDSEPRIDSLLTKLFGAADAPVPRWASRFLTLGAVQRTLEPGCKLDEMPVLIAPQGRGKSALLAELLPPEHRAAWFSDSLQLDANAKERAESLLGRVIVEAGELAGIGRADLAALKSFLTRQNDGCVRLAYRRDPEVMLRRCVIVGSVDRPECLPNDPAGLRRFVPTVLPGSSHVEETVPPIREQLWAEALERHQQGDAPTCPEN